MAEEILMPKLKETMEKGTVIKWHKREGDPVEKGEILFSITVDKANADIESTGSGILLKVLTQPGKLAKCGKPVALIGEAGEEIPDIYTMEAESALEASDKIKVTVIGGGPGGYVAAICAAQNGAEVTLIERAKLGGTCLNQGCIPTKSLLHSAELFTRIKNAGEYGIVTKDVHIDWKKVQEAKEAASRQLSDGVAGLMVLNGIELLTGEASFTGPKELKVQLDTGEVKMLEPDRIIIASGSVPVIPPIPGVKDNPNCIDSTAALSLTEIPKRMVVIGGGVIGIELAWAYACFGTEVTVLELLPKLLPMMDDELTMIVRNKMEQAGIRFLLETNVVSVEPHESGAKVKAVRKDGSEAVFEAEKVLVATGRRPDTIALNLEAAGIVTERGRIQVDRRMRTNVPDVYAIGDCVGKIMLAHTASAMGEAAAHNATGGRAVYREDVCPACVYLDPEFAGVGITEEQAAEKGISFKVGKFPMAANGKARIEGSLEGWVKVITEKSSDQLLGVHILGPRATDMIAEAALAIRQGLTAGQFTDVIHAHPTVAESVREAVLAVDGRAIHFK